MILPILAEISGWNSSTNLTLLLFTYLGKLGGNSCRGKEMSLSRFLGSYYKLPKSDSNAVYLLPNAVYLLQCCFIAANFVWAGQCDNSLFPWKLYKINLTAQQTINTAITN